jgi:hypothetical protein
MDLERLSLLMFRAEAQDDVEGVAWEQFLDDVLADDFGLRRSNPAKPLEDKAAFLAATRAAQPMARSLVPGRTRTWTSGDLGVSTSVVKLPGRPEHFTNTRVFRAGGPHGWRCHWWQVTAAQPEPVAT